MKPLQIASILAVLLIASFSRAAGPVVLFDQGHGQRFVIEKTGELNLGGLAAAFRAAGFEVRSTDKPITAAALTGVRALVTSGGFVPFTAEEVGLVKEFVRNGGNLAVMMHIAPTYQTLAGGFGVAGSPGVIHETENVPAINSLDFEVKNLSLSPLFAGIDSFNAYGCWAVIAHGEGAAPLARTSKSAWLDLNGNKVRDDRAEPLTQFSVVTQTPMGKGKAIFFGDDAIFQDRFLTGNNAKLAANMANWFGKSE